jgi:hypothetical protein
MGEQTFTLTLIASNVLSEIQERGGSLARRQVGELLDGTYRGYFLSGTNILEKDQVIDAQGIVYEVMFVDKVFRNHHLEVTLQRPYLLAAS